MLGGRSTECARLEGMLDAADEGRSDVLVLRGEPGIGKTALLGFAGERATGRRVVRAGGVESEVELAFAAVHRMCGEMLDALDDSPAPQGRRSARRSV